MTLEVQEKGVKVMKSKKRESKMWELKIIYDFKKKVSIYNLKRNGIFPCGSKFKRILSINFYHGGLTRFMSLNRTVNLPLGESK